MVRDVVMTLVTHWTFAREMAARDLKGLNQGALLGVAWLVLRPFVQVAAYVVIVSFIFGARLGEDAGPFDYALYVLSGLIPWQVISRSLEEAPSLIRDRMDMLTKVIYPIETLPLSVLLTALVGPGVGLAVYLALGTFAGELSWSVLLLPLPLIALAALVLGASWVFMIAGVVVKDLREVVSVVFALIVYASPVIVSETMVGERVAALIMLNPLAHVVVAFRDVFWGTFHPTSWAIFASMSAISFVGGAWVVRRAKGVINEYI